MIIKIMEYAALIIATLFSLVGFASVVVLTIWSLSLSIKIGKDKQEIVRKVKAEHNEELAIYKRENLKLVAAKKKELDDEETAIKLEQLCNKFNKKHKKCRREQPSDAIECVKDSVETVQDSAVIKEVSETKPTVSTKQIKTERKAFNLK